MAKKRLPKKPKARKLPKKPKQSASLQAWKNYETKRHATEQHNKSAESAWKKACEKIHSEEKLRLSIIRKHSR